MIEKVLFLDIDYVLNCDQCVGIMPIGSDHAQHLNRVIATTNAYVVVSSTWRKENTIAMLETFLKLAGFERSVLSVTPISKHGYRGDEITEWLKRFPTRTYAIVDDSDDMGKHLGRLVKTNKDEGLTAPKADELIKLLNQP